MLAHFRSVITVSMHKTKVGLFANLSMPCTGLQGPPGRKGALGVSGPLGQQVSALIKTDHFSLITHTSSLT